MRFRPAAMRQTIPMSSLTTDTLWTPNKTLTDVGLAFEVTDDSDAELEIELLVFSNETDRDATGGDAWVDSGQLWLRAERNGNGSGRVYLIVIIATDSGGASSFDCCSVVVPHDKSGAALDVVDAQATLAEVDCLLGGTAPEGYRLVESVSIP